MRKTVVQATKTAHGDAADEGVFLLVGEGQDASREIDQFLADKGREVVVVGRLVQIEGILAVGDDDGDALELAVSTKRQIVDELRRAGSVSWQEVEGFVGRLAASEGAVVVGQEDLNGDLAHEAGRDKAE